MLSIGAELACRSWASLEQIVIETSDLSEVNFDDDDADDDDDIHLTVSPYLYLWSEVASLLVISVLVQPHILDVTKGWKTSESCCEPKRVTDFTLCCFSSSVAACSSDFGMKASSLLWYDDCQSMNKCLCCVLVAPYWQCHGLSLVGWQQLLVRRLATLHTLTLKQRLFVNELFGSTRLLRSFCYCNLSIHLTDIWYQLALCTVCTYNLFAVWVFSVIFFLWHVCHIVQPFYGGKRDQLTAELYTPQDKKISFCTVKGAWNGIMWARCAQSVSTYDNRW